MLESKWIGLTIKIDLVVQREELSEPSAEELDSEGSSVNDRHYLDRNQDEAIANDMIHLCKKLITIVNYYL